MSSILVIFLVGFSFLLVTSVASGQPIIVDKSGTSKYKSINDAIQAAGEYDEILVKPGEYFETLNLNRKKQITIKADGEVLIKAKDLSVHALTECYKVEINGFKFSSPLILKKCESVIISGNLILGAKGGVLVSNSSATGIYSNTFARCTSTPVVIDESQQTRIINNLLYDNVSTEGIRISRSDLGDDIIQNNTIAYNKFMPITIGENCAARITNNIISFNSIPGNGPVITAVMGSRKSVARFNNIYQNKNSSGVAPPHSGIDFSNDVPSDPQFTHGDGRNFSLSSSSPCLGAGTDGTDRFGAPITGMILGAVTNFAGTPPNFDEMYEDGLSHFKMKRLTQSVETLKNLLQWYPANPDVLIALGNSYLAIKQYKEGASVYERSLKFRANNGVAFYNLACAYSLMGKNSDALKWLELAVKTGEFNRNDLENDPDIESLRKTPEFKKILELTGN